MYEYTPGRRSGGVLVRGGWGWWPASGAEGGGVALPRVGLGDVARAVPWASRWELRACNPAPYG